jgi:hypothetical protein
MGTNDKIKLNVIKWMLILSIAFMVELKSCSVHAQGIPYYGRVKSYWGFEGSFGTRSFSLRSDIAAIDGMKVIEEGGSAGVIVGVEAVQIKVRGGFYYSSSKVCHTVNLFETEGTINLRPLQLVGPGHRVLEPYAFAGINKSTLKFHGFYNQNGIDNSKVNFSTERAPYLGKILLTSATLGFGIDFRLPERMSFIHLFSEVKYSAPINQESGSPMFGKTTTSDQLALNVGVSFGAVK